MNTFKTQLTLLLLAISLLPAFSQTEKTNLEVIHKIKQEGLHNSQIEDLAFYFTDYVGSAEKHIIN
jgi:hypothetical protein